MAYDNKKLKTIKWLERLACESRPYNRKYKDWLHDNERLSHIFARFGRMCALIPYGDCEYGTYTDYDDQKRPNICPLKEVI